VANTGGYLYAIQADGLPAQSMPRRLWAQWRCALAVALACAFLSVGLCWGMNALSAAQCHATWGHRYATSYRFLTGCQVEVGRGIWLPASAIRIPLG
jgi:hypothetical protein